MMWCSGPFLVVLCSMLPLALALSAPSNNNSNSNSIYDSSSNQKPIPVTILSGFLGSGKTTLLQNMLQNKQGLKIAVVVNDVASVNVDSKLVARDTMSIADDNKGSDGMVELQNGCACCSLSDELLTSVSELVTMSDLRADEDQFDHIVVELSGVADPKQVRAKFQEAVMDNMPLMERVQLDTMVTLVDASMFESHFYTSKTASRTETPELYYVDGNAPSKKSDQEEEWKKDMPPKLLEALMAGLFNEGETGEESTNGVVDLLVSQTETADLVVLNKIDLVSDEELQRLQDITTALNPRAKVLTTSFGKLALQDILGVAGGQGVAGAGAVDDHRDFITAAVQVGAIIPTTHTSNSHAEEDKTLSVQTAASSDCTDADCTDESHSHSHAHSEHADDNCADSACTDDSHSHSHASHDTADASHDSNCVDPACTDDSHSHSHAAHDAAACADPDCTDESHSHSHSHTSHDTDCADPDCTDGSHSHSHAHSQAGHAGIGTFVYEARRPFHPGRLVSFLRNLPVVRGIPEAEDTKENRLPVSAEIKETLANCLRSKGFVWCADSHKSAMYWSHAGSSFELSCLGQWWATLPRDQWPEGVDDYVLQDFDDATHDDATNPIGVGDRRQEVVFIGNNFASASYQSQIRETLNQCLLDDQEYKDYTSMQDDDAKLAAKFVNVLESKYVTY